MKSFSFRKLEPNEGEMLGEITLLGSAGFMSISALEREGIVIFTNVNAVVISALSVWISNLNSFHQI